MVFLAKSRRDYFLPQSCELAQESKVAQEKGRSLADIVQTSLAWVEPPVCVSAPSSLAFLVLPFFVN